MYSTFMQYREVLIIGGTGFVGRHLCRALIAEGRLPRLLVREGSEARIPPDIREHCRVTPGDATEYESVENAAQGTEAVFNLVGIVREFPASRITFARLHVAATLNATRAARRWGIAPFIHVSALGALAGSPSGYLDTKGRAEEIVRNSGLRWTILRPSVVFGPGDRIVGRLREMARRVPIVPVPGDGRALLQPVYVGDVARGLALALSRDAMARRSFDVGGAERLAFDAIMDRVVASPGRNVRKVHLPLGFMRAAARLLSRFERFPLSIDEIAMLNTDSVCDSTDYFAILGTRPVSLSEYLAGRIGVEAPGTNRSAARPEPAVDRRRAA